MEINTTQSFLAYLEKTRESTRKVILAIPHDQLDWRYKEGKFSLGDLIRHIAAIERYVFAEVAVGNKPAYRGCGKELADGYDEVLAYFDRLHAESIALFSTLEDADFQRKIKSLDGQEITLNAFLRALFVHEIHHRGALCIYLNLLGVESPPVIGLKEEQVILLSK